MMNRFSVSLLCILVGPCLYTEISASKSKIKPRAAIKYHTLTSAQKRLILDKHNELRRIVDPPAANMLTMSWDDGLERLATEYTKHCIYEHNPDRKLDGFAYVGENLYLAYGKPVDDKYGPNAVKAWDSEKKYYLYESGCTANQVCGHYIQTAWAESYKVGCGMTTCPSIQVSDSEIWYDATLFACNYAPGGNYQGVPIYSKGEHCTECPKGYSCVDKLCFNATRDGQGSLHNFAFWQYILALTILFGNKTSCYIF